jgi:hypothetical protein
MTDHIFQPTPSETHNGQSFYFCGTCNAARIIRHGSMPGQGPGPWGPYVIPIDAEKFTTCEAAFEEAKRLEAESERREKERLAERANRRAAGEAFSEKHPFGFYWVRFGGELTVAKLNPDPYDNKQPYWQLLGGNEEDDFVRPFDDLDIELVQGPIAEPT